MLAFLTSHFTPAANSAGTSTKQQEMAYQLQWIWVRLAQGTTGFWWIFYIVGSIQSSLLWLIWLWYLYWIGSHHLSVRVPILDRSTTLEPETQQPRHAV